MKNMLQHLIAITLPHYLIIQPSYMSNISNLKTSKALANATFQSFKLCKLFDASLCNYITHVSLVLANNLTEDNKTSRVF